VVFNGDKVVGMLTDRRILRKFIPFNKKPEEVTVRDVMSPLFKIQPDASAKEVRRRLVEAGITRLGVFEGDKFLGWVTGGPRRQLAPWEEEPAQCASPRRPG
jgi:CBS domain-containing protein